jgi:AraC-like DNA-binding protein
MRLERLSGIRDQVSRVRTCEAMPGVDLMRAYFRGVAFSPHRHDTYAVGVTHVGIQSFRYRGERHHSHATRAFVLHPDELHDGEAGDDLGFGYAIAYIDPAIIRGILETGPLPFLQRPVSDDLGMRQAILGLITDWTMLREPLALDDALTDLAVALRRAAGGPDAETGMLDTGSAFRIREHLLDAGSAAASIEEIAADCGLSRWQATRRFRQAFGVSPYRYLLMRRLDHARRLLAAGTELAQAALEAGFADQAHLTRRFRQAFGMAPGAWRRTVIAPSN